MEGLPLKKRQVSEMSASACAVGSSSQVQPITKSSIESHTEENPQAQFDIYPVNRQKTNINEVTEIQTNDEISDTESQTSDARWLKAPETRRPRIGNEYQACLEEPSSDD